MFIINFIRFLSGYLTVSFSGEFAERLINICAKNRISLWNLKQYDGIIYVNIGIKSFKRLRFLKRKCNVKVKIIKRCGVRFIISSNKLRFGAVIGVVVYFLVLVYLSGFIWSIEIYSNKPVDENQIITQLKNLGITQGVRKRNIDSSNQRIELIMNVDDLSWAALNIEGTKLSVDVSVSEKINKKDNRPSNLIAYKDAVIKRIFITSGQTLVSTDQAVLKGDMLVSGVIEDKMGNTILKHSDGEVFAITKENVSVTVPLEQEYKVKTGKCKKRTVIQFFNLKVPLFLGSVKFEHNKQLGNKQLEILGKKLPITINKAIFFETKHVKNTIDTKQAIELANDQFAKKMENTNYVSYDIIQTQVMENFDSVTVIYSISGEENIAVQEILSINTTN